MALTRKRPQRQEEEWLRSDFLETEKLADTAATVVISREILARRDIARMTAKQYVVAMTDDGGEISD